MSGSHDLNVQNLRLHERIVEEKRQNKRLVGSAISAAPTARHGGSARPPAKPATVVTCQADSKMGSKAASKMGSRAGSKAESKTGSKHQTSHHNKEVLVVTVIEEEEEEEEGEEEEETLPPKAPSLASKHHNNKPPSHSAKPPASKASSQHSNHRNRDWNIYHIPTGFVPLPPHFSKVRRPEFAEWPKETNDMALVKLPSLVPAARSTVSAAAALPRKQVAKRYPPASSHVGSSSSSHHSKTSSHHTKTKVLEDGGGGGGGGSGGFRDVVFEEVRRVTKRRYVVKMPADEIGEWRF
ncbi:hypothetical protein KCU73_g5381, partial [Aureobasidium melanogenum]